MTEQINWTENGYFSKLTKSKFGVKECGLSEEAFTLSSACFREGRKLVDKQYLVDLVELIIMFYGHLTKVTTLIEMVTTAAFNS